MQVLVVDDSRTIQRMLANMLEAADISVTTTGNGAEALAVLRKIDPPDLILIDWNMPVMNGLEFLREVRSDANHATAAVMMITTETDIDQMAKALAEGADEYLMKPFTREALFDKLDLLGVLAEEPHGPSA